MLHLLGQKKFAIEIGTCKPAKLIQNVLLELTLINHRKENYIFENQG